MPILTRTYTVVIKDYDHMTTMDTNVNSMKPTHLLSIFLWTLSPPFAHPPLLQNNLIAFLDVHNIEN